MYKIKQLLGRIRNLIRWAPIIWKDRDWDYYFIYEILKQKLINVEKFTRGKGIHFYNNRDADDILKAIDLINKVQTEYHLDKYLSEATEWTTEGMNKSTKDHDKARQELFRYLSNNIEKWWD
jgi:hypothetical protein